MITEPGPAIKATSRSDVKSASEGNAFFVFEGIDGAGKSTVIKIVGERLEALGHDVVVTAEPTGSWIGDCVRRANREHVTDLAETFLFIADRAEHTEDIRRSLSEGAVVLCDRYVSSTLAYQGVVLEHLMGPKTLDWLRTVNSPFMIGPGITFFLKIDPEVAMARLGGRKERAKFEKLDFLRKVDAIYQKLSFEDLSFVTIEASRPIDKVVDQVLAMINERLE